MLYNKLAIELLYEELKGKDHSEYLAIRNRYKNHYEATEHKTPFEKFWAMSLQRVRKYHDYKLPKRKETLVMKQARLAITTDTAKIAELREKLRRRTAEKLD